MTPAERSLFRKWRSLRKLSDEQYLAILLEASGLRPLQSQENAHILTQELGSIDVVLTASRSLLASQVEISDDAFELFSLYYQFIGQYLIGRAEETHVFHTVYDLYTVLLALFFDQPAERFYALLLGPDNAYLDKLLLGDGITDNVYIPTRKLVNTVAAIGATGVILTHNHPSRIPAFSDNDLNSSLAVAQRLASMDVPLYDHILFCENRFYSLRDRLGLGLDSPWPPPPKRRRRKAAP